MFFADDSYVFCKATSESANDILQLLNIFEIASGQQINRDKSSIFFSKNIPSHLKNDLCQQLRFKEATYHSLYSGLPNIIGRNKSAIFGYVKEKLQDCIQRWDKKTISKCGEEVILKSVAQSLPNYTMGVFFLPMDLCQQLERTMCKYWWSTVSKKSRNIHWQSWTSMCKNKLATSMGFKNVRDFNVSLMGKQDWRLLKYPNKLVSRVYKARYYPHGSFLDNEIGSNPSYIWRSVLESQALIKKGVSCRVGNG